jgi:LysM repeat protein
MHCKPAFLLFALILLPALACNYPGLSRGAATSQASELRATIQAIPTETARFFPSLTAEAVLPTLIPTTTSIPAPDPPGVSPTAPPGYYTYTVQPGDTLEAVSTRFESEVGQISSSIPLPKEGYLPAGQVLFIPWEAPEAFQLPPLMPDSEITYSPTALDFDAGMYIQASGGFLNTYTQTLDSEILTGAQVVERVAIQSSINPRLLLAFLEYRSGWVRGQPFSSERTAYPLGFVVPGKEGLYDELNMAATQLNSGYYGWRSGNQLSLSFPDKTTARLHPATNAGSAAAARLFSKFYRLESWQEVVYAPGGFLWLYREMFGDPWQRAAEAGDVSPAGAVPPDLELPFLPGERWSLTAGPHIAWDSGTPRGALDFSPVTGEPVCVVSRVWVTASAPGVIASARHNRVALDLDGDGYEHTGWVLIYFHIASEDIIPAGTRVDVDDPLGHPSCEGGRSTGKHVHIARKYNGEWLAADGPAPFLLSGWLAEADERAYQGRLVKGDQVVSSNSSGNRTSIILR